MEDRFRRSERGIPGGKKENEEDSKSQELFLKNLNSDDFKKWLIRILFKLFQSIEKEYASIFLRRLITFTQNQAEIRQKE